MFALFQSTPHPVQHYFRGRFIWRFKHRGGRPAVTDFHSRKGVGHAQFHGRWGRRVVVRCDLEDVGSSKHERTLDALPPFCYWKRLKRTLHAVVETHRPLQFVTGRNQHPSVVRVVLQSELYFSPVQLGVVFLRVCSADPVLIGRLVVQY
jgi:hypothetical protein